MAMGARFSDELDWTGKTLEVCGPATFDDDTLMIEVLSFTITDATGRTVTQVCNPPARAVPGVNDNMWESEIPNAKGKLASGKAQGQGSALAILRGQPAKHFTWHQGEPADPDPLLSIA
jgi:hypothetical protein